MSSKQPLLRVRGLKKNYPRQRRDASLPARCIGALLGWTGVLDDYEPLNEGLPVLKGIDLDVMEDETLAIIGPSGAGKSTLLHLIGALDRPTDGSVLYRDRSIQSLSHAELDAWRNGTVGFVFQFYHLFPDLDAHENVLIPAKVAHSTLQYMSRKAELEERAHALLKQVGLEDRIGHRPSQLSGGEQQRVAIARALMLEPELLLLDEPTGNLDRKTGESILELLWKLKAESGQTYVIVTHDQRLAKRADRVAYMVDGNLLSVDRPLFDEEGELVLPNSGTGEVPTFDDEDDVPAFELEEPGPKTAEAAEPEGEDSISKGIAAEFDA